MEQMENKIREGFDTLQMSEELSQKIEISLAKGRKKNRRTPVAVAAACAALVLLCTCTPTATAMAQAVEDTVVRILESILGPGRTVTEQTEFFEGGIVIESGVNAEGAPYIASVLNTMWPSWLKAREDGLYFTANGEEIDITDQIGETRLFTYTHTENGYIYFYAVAGVYDPLLRQDLMSGRKTGNVFGFYVGIAQETEQGPQFVTACARGYLDEEENELPWFTEAKELWETSVLWGKN